MSKASRCRKNRLLTENMPHFEEFDPLKIKPEQAFGLFYLKTCESLDNDVALKTSNVS